MNNTYHTFQYKDLLDFTIQVFTKMGCTPEHAHQISTFLLRADLRGIDSHGIARLTGYVRLWEAGRIVTDSQAYIVHETPSTATLDGAKGVGMQVGYQAMQIAIEKAKNCGSGWVAVKNSNHFGIAANFSIMALEHNMIGIAMTNASALVAPTFSKERMLGTNPICYAFPSKNEAPFVADFATTTAANGKLEILQRKQLDTPNNWVQDKDGHPSNDAHILKKGGSLLPLGGDISTSGHKGYALGSIVDILTGVLSGASFGPFAPPFPAYVPMPQFMPGEGLGHFFGAMRVDGFRPLEDYFENMDLWLKTFRNAEPIHPEQKTLIPGDNERRYEEERIKNGIPLIDVVVNDLKQLGAHLNIPFNLTAI